MTVPCYDCCEYCQEYDSCSGYGGCEKCRYHTYGECRIPHKEDVMLKAKPERKIRLTPPQGLYQPST